MRNCFASGGTQRDLGLQVPARPLRLSRDLRDIPVDCYRLPEDGRKWKSVARERMALAEWLATHGDADGSRIFVSVASMSQHFGWSRGKTFCLLSNLESLGLLEKKGLLRPRGPRKRHMNIAAFLTAATARTAEVQDSGPKSRIREQESNVTLDRTVLLTEQTENPRGTPPRASPSRFDLDRVAEQRRKIDARDRRLAAEAEFRREVRMGSGPEPANPFRCGYCSARFATDGQRNAHVDFECAKGPRLGEAQR